MEKCSMCSKKFPDETMHKMIQIVGKKAYAQNICPACRGLAAANPNYYDAAAGFSQDAEWVKVIDEAHKLDLPADVVIDLIQSFVRNAKKLKK
ncbi:MAG: hypothetical protein ACM3PE_09425 [Deltaproteobacteria bacterium]